MLDPPFARTGWATGLFHSDANPVLVRKGSNWYMRLVEYTVYSIYRISAEDDVNRGRGRGQMAPCDLANTPH